MVAWRGATREGSVPDAFCSKGEQNGSLFVGEKGRTPVAAGEVCGEVALKRLGRLVRVVVSIGRGAGRLPLEEALLADGAGSVDDAVGVAPQVLFEQRERR